MTSFDSDLRLGDLAGNYDALLCDAWGVIHNGQALFDGAEDALCRFRRDRGPVIILTNAPRPSGVIPRQLDRLGLSRDAYDGVVTSGDATRAEIAKRADQPIYRIGPDKDDELYRGLDIEMAPLEAAGAIVCTGLFDDTTETPEDYRSMLVEAADRNLDMVCANPDIRVRWGDRLIYCAGALAALYETLGGRVIHAGKPHTPIYALSREMLDQIRPNGAARILAIGDGLQTDILGANQQNIDVVYVYGAGGIHDGETDASALANALDGAGVHALGAMERLRWS